METFNKIKTFYKWDETKKDWYKVCIKYNGKQYTFSFFSRLSSNVNKFYFVKALLSDWMLFDTGDYVYMDLPDSTINGLAKNYERVTKMFSDDEILDLLEYINSQKYSMNP